MKEKIEVLRYGLEVFSDKDKFKLWLMTPNTSMGGKLPKSLLWSSCGIEEVKGCLNRIEHGIFA